MITGYLQEKIKHEDGLDTAKPVPALTFEQERARQFRMIDYLFKQPEMDKVISLTPEERHCFELKRFVASVPFNNEMLDTSKLFQKTRDQFEGISFRSLIYNFLMDEAFDGTQIFNEANQNYQSLLTMKQNFFNMLNDQEMQKLTFVYGKWDKTLEKGQEEMTKLEKSKIYNLNQFSNVQNNIIKIQTEIQSISDRILQEYPLSNDIVRKYREGEDFMDGVMVSTEPEMFASAKFVSVTFNSHRDLINSTIELVKNLRELNNFEKMDKWVVLQKYDGDNETVQLRKDLKKQIPSSIKPFKNSEYDTGDDTEIINKLEEVDKELADEMGEEIESGFNETESQDFQDNFSEQDEETNENYKPLSDDDISIQVDEE